MIERRCCWSASRHRRTPTARPQCRVLRRSPAGNPVLDQNPLGADHGRYQNQRAPRQHASIAEPKMIQASTDPEWPIGGETNISASGKTRSTPGRTRASQPVADFPGGDVPIAYAISSSSLIPTVAAAAAKRAAASSLTWTVGLRCSARFGYRSMMRTRSPSSLTASHRASNPSAHPRADRGRP